MNKIMLAFLLALAWIGAPAQSSAAALPAPAAEAEGVSEYRLANGLRVLLLPESAKGITTVNLTVLAGSAAENYGETGMAHLLEHLIFKGSARFDNPAAEMGRRGLRFNGTTSDDRTNYFATFSASDDNLGWYLDWLADALVNSRIDRKDLDSEMTVVRNEMERGENNAESVLLQRMRAAAFQWHNYGKATIGARSDVEHVDIERLRAFYRRHYQPDNALLIVTGKFDPARTLQRIQATFGALPKPQRVLEPRYTLDPAQDGERVVTVRRAGDVALLGALYHIMPAAHPDYPAAALLASIVGAEPEGRLYRALGASKLAAGTLGWSAPRREPGYLVFGVRLNRDVAVEVARAKMLATLDGLAAEPVSQEEMEQAKVRWLNQFDQTLSDPVNAAGALSEAAAAGDWRLLFLQRARVEQLSLEQLRAVAQRWLVPDNRTLGVYLPEARPQRAPEPAFVDLARQFEGFQGGAAIAAVKPFDPSLDALDAKIERFTLDNGMQVALLPKDARGGKLRAVFTMRYGTPQSLAAQRAVAPLTLAMLERGTRDLSRVGLAFKGMSLGISNLNLQSGAGWFSASLQGNGARLPEIVALLNKVMCEPAFQPDEFERLKAETVSKLERRRSQPDSIAAILLDQAVYPYPAGDVRAVLDIEQQIAQAQAVTLDQVKAFHREFFGTANAELALVGAFDAAAARQELAKALGDWRAPQPYQRIRYEHLAPEPRRLSAQVPDKKSATYVADLALPVGDDDPDYPALLVANRILGVGFDGRLMRRVRGREGLSYSVGSWLVERWPDAAAHWRIYASFAPQNRDRIEQVIEQELLEFAGGGISAGELKAAVDSLLERRLQMRSEDGSLAALLAENLEKGRDFKWQAALEARLRALDAADVNRAIARLIGGRRWSISTAGDFASAK